MPSPARERAEQSLHAQYAVSRALAESSTLREATPRVLAALGDTLDWDVGALWTLDRGRGELRCSGLWHSAAMKGDGSERESLEASFPARTGLPGRVWQEGKPCWIADVANDGDLARTSIAAKAGLHGTFAFPIRLENRILGVIEYFSREILFQPDEVLFRLAETVGHQVGQFIDRMRVERESRESADRYRLILENALEYAIFTTDVEGRVTTWNAGAQQILGYEETEIVGRSLDMIFTAEDRQAGQLASEMKLAQAEGRARDERWHLRKEGTRFWASGLMMPLKDEDGHHLGFLKILRDRTSKRRAEEALRSSEIRFRQLADAMPQIVWTAGPDGSVDYHNRRWFELTGLPEDSTANQSWEAVLDSHDQERWNELWVAAVRSGEPFQIECRFRSHAPGYSRWFLSRALATRDETGEIVRWYGTCTDIDDQKRGEDRYVRLNQTMLSVLETFPDVVFLMGLDASIHFKNPAAGEFARAVGMQGRLPAPIEAELQRVLQTGEDHSPTSFKTVHRFEIENEERYFLNRIAAMKTPDGMLFGAVVMLQDVTEFRLLDEVKTNVISTVSHELKTPLTSIRTVLLMFMEHTVGTLNPRQTELIEIANSESERLLHTLETLLDLTRFEAGAMGMHRERISVAQLIQAALDETSVAAANAQVVFKLELEDSLPMLEVDRERIVHALSNLVGNAIKYSPAGSEIIIRAQKSEQGVYFAVVDQGAGVPKQYLSRVFERFFRVPGTPKKGAGLGLSIAREFVHAHRGRIGVQSEDGKGSEFYFVLPASGQ